MPDRDGTRAVRDFQGLNSAAGPHLLQAGQTQIQRNIACKANGRLGVRDGLKPTAFDNAITAVSSPVISSCSFPTPYGNYIVYQNAAGQIKAGRNPA